MKMSPGQHADEAERLVNAWQETMEKADSSDMIKLSKEIKVGHELAMQLLAAAQVHATLATRSVTLFKTGVG